MSCGVRAGKLNRYVELQTNTASTNTYGEPVESWSSVANVWAEKMDPKATERFAGDQFVATKQVSWRIRWRSDVDFLDRLVYDGVNYDIHGTIEVGFKKELILITEAVLDR